MKKVITLWIFMVLLLASAALAETTIKAEVDKNRLASEETLTYKLTLSSTENKIPAPKLPAFKGFGVISQAQSTTATFAGKQNKTVMEFVFILLPTATGKFKIDPSSIKIKNKIISTASFQIQVTPGKIKPQPPRKEKSPLPEEIQPESEAVQITL